VHACERSVVNNFSGSIPVSMRRPLRRDTGYWRLSDRSDIYKEYMRVNPLV